MRLLPSRFYNATLSKGKFVTVLKCQGMKIYNAFEV
jgi:hypothetical protein